MGLFDGGLFDFSGDGETSLDEEFLGFMVINELTREDEAELRDEDDFASGG